MISLWSSYGSLTPTYTCDSARPFRTTERGPCTRGCGFVRASAIASDSRTAQGRMGMAHVHQQVIVPGPLEAF